MYHIKIKDLNGNTYHIPVNKLCLCDDRSNRSRYFSVAGESTGHAISEEEYNRLEGELAIYKEFIIAKETKDFSSYNLTLLKYSI